jgi:diguanylate cyclase (GGDEF)-like protein
LIAFFTHVFPNSLDFPRGWAIYFHIFSAVFYAAVFHIIAFFYSNKFNAAEQNLRDVNNKLRQMASTDTLTSLPNRRTMNEHLTMLAYNYERSNQPFVIAIADIDLFKKINDTYGHDAGDYILQSVSAIFRNTMEGNGMIARWGGEEFLFAFENASGNQAKNVLEGMRNQIEKTDFQYKDEVIKVTITLGIEDYSVVSGVEATISKADSKLYRGKSEGRNRVVY